MAVVSLSLFGRAEVLISALTPSSQPVAQFLTHLNRTRVHQAHMN